MPAVSRTRAFMLIELLVVIALIGILASLILVFLQKPRQSAQIASARAQQVQITKAIEFYATDMGFYPPDVNRGWDPGFARPFPWNADLEAGEPVSPEFAVSGTNCGHCPPNWQDIVNAQWNGPYLPVWPRRTPWGGRYDYNYWANGVTRSGCYVPPGIYAGIQGDYDEENIIFLSAEEEMVEKGFDAENCINGESQMLLWSFNN